MKETCEGPLGLFPGTFDPIHLGHVEIALIAKEWLDLKAVIFVPNFEPPHKPFVNHASAYDRLCMVQMAIMDVEGFFVSDFEVKQGGVSYTINTIEHFAELYPNCDLRLLIGGDSLREMHTWKRIEDYSKYVKAVGISRAGEVIQADEIKIPDDLKTNLQIIEGINMQQSSTEIKRRISEELDLSAFLDPLVERYILKYGLYK